MKKLVLALAVCGVLLFGCLGGGDSTQPTVQSTQQGGVEQPTVETTELSPQISETCKYLFNLLTPEKLKAAGVKGNAEYLQLESSKTFETDNAICVSTDHLTIGKLLQDDCAYLAVDIHYIDPATTGGYTAKKIYDTVLGANPFTVTETNEFGDASAERYNGWLDESNKPVTCLDSLDFYKGNSLVSIGIKHDIGKRHEAGKQCDKPLSESNDDMTHDARIIARLINEAI